MINHSPYEKCTLCPRRCGVCRDGNIKGYCGESAVLRLASASIHRGEEPPVSGSGGSGTIFVSGCNLGCVFCQNWQISGSKHFILGKFVNTSEFVKICLVLQEKGAHNINIVTGSHAVPAIVAGITAAKAAGLRIPVLWNSSAYELPETLEMLGTTVDVFLPDLKTLDSSVAGQYHAPDYPAAATEAIKKMLTMRQLRYNGSLLVSGVMIRHLVLPDHLESTRKVLRWFADNCAGQALLSLMFQFTPINFPSPRHEGTKRDVQFAKGQQNFVSLRLCERSFPKESTEKPGTAPDRFINQEEYDTVLGWLTEFGIEDGYCQELVPGNTDWLPDFEKENPFPSDLSVPVWHWKNGFLY